MLDGERSGRGVLRIEDTNLFETSSIFKGLPSLNQLRSKFAVNNDRFIFTEFYLSSPVMSLTAADGGYINYMDSKVNMDLEIKSADISVDFLNKISKVGQMLVKQGGDGAGAWSCG